MAGLLTNVITGKWLGIVDLKTMRLILVSISDSMRRAMLVLGPRGKNGRRERRSESGCERE